MNTLTFSLALFSFVSQATQGQLEELKPTDIYTRNVSSVVLIKATLADGSSVSQGSGFLVSPDGKILTNYHVLQHAKSASVFLANGDAYDTVDVIEIDKRKDIALIRIKAVDQKPVALGRSSVVAPGQKVLAITNPQGLQNSLSEGIISAIRQADGHRLFQITSPISAGSSGGPIFDSHGEVIGIAVGSYTEGQNLNLAIPIDYARGMLVSTNLQSLASVYEPRPVAENSAKSSEGTPSGSKTSANQETLAALEQLREALKRKGSVIFTEQLIGKWTATEFRLMFGEPLRYRPSIDVNTRKEDGVIVAYDDPTKQNREIELRYDAITKHLTTAFFYPWNMTWEQCKRLWGGDVTTVRQSDGRRFYQYRNRRLTVFTEKTGTVINFFVY